MNEQVIKEMVLRVVLMHSARQGEYFVPVASSNRHAHLSQADVERLFGQGYQLTRLRDLNQPGQYACKETVVMEGEKGKTTLRVVGPARKETQIELSYTDCYKLGVKPVMRMSGDTTGTPGCALINGDRRIVVSQGVMVAKRHLHMSPEEAAAYGLTDGDIVALEAPGGRAAVLENLVVRSGAGHSLEAHIDKDEANACGFKDGQLCRILVAQPRAELVQILEEKPEPLGRVQLQTYVPPIKADVPTKTKLMDLTGEPHAFIAEEDILSAVRNDYKIIRYKKGAVITPLARDMALARGLELIEIT